MGRRTGTKLGHDTRTEHILRYYIYRELGVTKIAPDGERIIGSGCNGSHSNERVSEYLVFKFGGNPFRGSVTGT